MAAAAVACPLHEDAAHLDVLYAVLPPQYGTGEWLALASLAARQYQQAEQVWRARAAAESHAALERELQRARQIQMRLVPRNPSVPGLDLAVGFTPCRWVGGDYVDVVPMADGRTLLTVADVCGKGLAAALVSSSLHTMVHGGVAAGLDLRGLMRTLSNYLARSLPEESFVTMVAVAIDPAAGTVECVNAGHPPPLVINPGAKLRELHSGENLPLGCDPTEELESHSYELAPGGLLALYTDGLTEQTDAAGELLGMAGLTAWIGDICATEGIAAAAAADALTQRSEALRGSRPPDDDRTFLLARRV
jgi:serine phosphatase RsbU (regulator of sigma subunit)